MIPIPRQQKRPRIPPNQQLRITPSRIRQCISWISSETTHIYTSDTQTTIPQRKHLRNGDSEKVPRTTIIAGPEPSVAMHAGLATAADDEVAFVLAAFEIVEAVVRCFVEIVGVETPELDGGFGLGVVGVAVVCHEEAGGETGIVRKVR